MIDFLINSENKYDLVTIGEVLIDMISNDYQINSSMYERKFGGSPANIAINTRQLGLNSQLIGAIGRDSFGQFILDELQVYELDKNLINVTNYPTSMVVVTKSLGTPQPIFYRGADFHLTINNHLNVISNSKIIHFSSWPLSKKCSREEIRQVIEIGRANQSLIAFDPNYHPLLWDDVNEGITYVKEFIGLVDIIKPSEDDAIRIFGEGFSIDEYLQKFIDLGVKLVIMTLGKDGLIAYDGIEKIKIASLATEVIDTTGAGDAFWSGLYYGLNKGLSIKECLNIGSLVSAHKLKYVGAISDLTPIIRELNE